MMVSMMVSIDGVGGLVGGDDGHGRVVADKGRYLYFYLHFVFLFVSLES